MIRNLVNLFKAAVPVLPVLISIFLGSGCAGNNAGLPVYTGAGKQASRLLLPAKLQSGSLSFVDLLQAYDSLNDKQKIAALAHFLEQTNLGRQEKAEAAYMLGRLAQQASQNMAAGAGVNPPVSLSPRQAVAPGATVISHTQTIELFEQAQLYPPLKAKSLWHKSEVAALLGKEKIVRQALAELLAEQHDPASLAATQYALAQSYLRTSEVEKASQLLDKIRHDFPATDYALGATYYLGTLSYSQFQKGLPGHSSPEAGKFIRSDSWPFKFGEQDNRQRSQADLLKNAWRYYFEYLQASPNGHFAPDILLKLDNLISHRCAVPIESELTTMANAYAATGQYKSSLAYWQKAGADRHLLAVSSCLVKLGNMDFAQTQFFRALAKYSGKNQADQQCLNLANEIGSHLKAGECLRFWQRLRRVQFPFQDEVLRHVAKMNNFPQNLSYYQDLLYHYPESVHASEAQWWLLWYKLKSSKISMLPATAEAFYKAANKYKQSLLAPRFLFWAGKIREELKETKKAALCYKQAAKLYPCGYYGQRSSSRLNFITNATPDEYFQTKFGGRLQLATNWQYPEPAKELAALKEKDKSTLYELIHLKQYDEALATGNDIHEELAAWLEGKIGQPWLSINTASRCLEEQSCHVPNQSALWQYSFPLLYNHEIVSCCTNCNGIDPLLVHSLIREESRYNPTAVSRAQAIGLCQLMPATACGIGKNIGIKITTNEELFKADSNLALGIYYLSLSLKTFHNEALPAIAGYNAGTNAVKHFLSSKGGAPNDPDQFVENFPFAETRDYVRKVFASYWHYRRLYQPE